MKLTMVTTWCKMYHVQREIDGDSLHLEVNSMKNVNREES